MYPLANFLSGGPVIPAVGGGAADGNTVRYVVGSWHAANIPANTAAGNIFFVDGNSNFDGYVLPRACVLTGISVRTSVASAGSALTINVKVNGLQDATLQATVALGSRVGYAVGTGPTLAAGDLIQPVYVTDASWTATTSDVSVLLEFTEV